MYTQYPSNKRASVFSSVANPFIIVGISIHSIRYLPWLCESHVRQFGAGCAILVTRNKTFCTYVCMILPVVVSITQTLTHTVAIAILSVAKTEFRFQMCCVRTRVWWTKPNKWFKGFRMSYFLPVCRLDTHDTHRAHTHNIRSIDEELVLSHTVSVAKRKKSEQK